MGSMTFPLKGGLQSVRSKCMVGRNQVIVLNNIDLNEAEETVFHSGFRLTCFSYSKPQISGIWTGSDHVLTTLVRVDCF